MFVRPEVRTRSDNWSHPVLQIAAVNFPLISSTLSEIKREWNYYSRGNLLVSRISFHQRLELQFHLTFNSL